MSDEIQSVLTSVGTVKEYPVLDWTPTQRQDIGLHIDVRTDWYIDQEPITNRKIIQLFSNLLVGKVWGADPTCTRYALITPHVAFNVNVLDVPFLLVDFSEPSNNCYEGITNRGEPIDFMLESVRYIEHPHTGIASPAIKNNRGCWVRFSRQCSIDWALSADY